MASWLADFEEKSYRRVRIFGLPKASSKKKSDHVYLTNKIS